MPESPNPNRTNAGTATGQLAADYAMSIVVALRDAGFLALWAGGCVRDHLRGVTPNDYDVATNATPAQVREVFGKRRTLAIGEQFGVVVVLGRLATPSGESVQQQVEVATFRKDAEYEDGRHPTSVEFSSPEEDACRRDFTVNGLFFDPIEKKIIDYVGGQKDLEQKVLRAIGNPHDRFDEDKLRMLRAVRFASTLSLTLDQETAAAIAARPRELSVVSAERVATELRKILVHEQRSQGLSLLQQTGLLPVIFPEFDGGSFLARWAPTLSAMSRLESPHFAMCLAMLFRHTRDLRSDAVIDLRQAATRQKLTNREIQLATWLLEHESTVGQAIDSPWPQVQRVLIHDDIELLLNYVEALLPEEYSADSIKFCREKLSLPTSALNPPAIIDGNDLMQHGIPRGAIYRRILTAVRDAQLLGTCDSKVAALELADQIASE